MPESNDAPEIFFCCKFVFRNAKIILAALQADSLNHRVEERIVPSNWREVECCNMDGHGEITFASSEKIRPEDVNYIYEWINKMDEACDVMRSVRVQRPIEDADFEHPR